MWSSPEPSRYRTLTMARPGVSAAPSDAGSVDDRLTGLPPSPAARMATPLLRGLLVPEGFLDQVDLHGRRRDVAGITRRIGDVNRPKGPR